MEPEISRLIQPQHLKEVARLWDGTAPVAPLDDVVNLVYPFFCQGRECILRLTHSSHHTLPQVLAELDWIAFLVRGGVQAATSVPSGDGRLAERIEVPGSSFTACVFEKAPGAPPNPLNPEVDQDALYFDWGRTLGRMHALTQRYDPGPHRGQRRNWREEESGLELVRAVEIVPHEEREVAKRAKESLAMLEGLSMGPDCFGLVHDDLNTTNFFVDGNRITVFDFDDCCYDWFASDLATTVPYFSSQFAGDQGEQHAHHFFRRFFAGYRQENELDPVWLQRLPDFFRLRNLNSILFSYTIDRENREEYKSFFDLIWKVYREGCTLFHFDFLKAYRESLMA